MLDVEETLRIKTDRKLRGKPRHRQHVITFSAQTEIALCEGTFIYLHSQTPSDSTSFWKIRKQLGQSRKVTVMNGGGN